MKLLQTTLYFLVFYLTLYSSTSSVLAQSQPVNNQPNSATINTSVEFQPPQDNSPNPPTVGAATRGSSCLDKQVITPLLPKKKSGLTLNKYPTFFWNIPDTSVREAKFSIQKAETEEVIYQTDLILPEQPGIVGFTLPKTGAGLEANQTYRWYVTLDCGDPGDNSNNPYIEGLVKLIPNQLPLSESQLESLEKENLLQATTIYAEKGIWYDALNSFVKLRCEQPNNQQLEINWQQFLGSQNVGLNNIASEPLVNSCTTKN
jgi:Domain of Unknown Function (DUF928)